MAQALTAAALLAKVRWRADIESMTLRHTDTALMTEINASWTALRTKVSDAGQGLYLKWVAGTLTAGVLAGHSFGSLTLPSDLVRIYAFEITLPSGQIASLDSCTMAERNAYRDQWGQATGRPQMFFVTNIGTESTTTVTAGTVGIVPAPDVAYPYSIGYLPAWSAIAVGNTTYVFDGYDGWDEWVVLDVTLKIAERDNDMQQTAALAAAERERVWTTRILPDCRVNRSGPLQRADTATQKRATRAALIRRGT
jgi:hypothetical protein